LKESPNLDLLILDGILNKVEEDEIRKNSNSDIHENFAASDSLLLHEQPRPEKAFFESQHGGLVSADGKYLYFMGIIDTLTGFGAKKMLEHTAKSIIYDGKTISCVPPFQYGERFFNFMQEHVF
jgi:hypothetical protein